LISGCSPLPNGITIPRDKPLSAPELDFEATIKLETNFNRFIHFYEFKDGFVKYFARFAPKWRIIDAESSVKSDGSEICAKVKAYKNLFAFSDSHAEISISTNMAKGIIEQSLRQKSRFNGHPQSLSVDSFDLGVTVAASILKTLSTNKEFYNKANLLSEQLHLVEKKRREEKRRKQTPEVANKEVIKRYKELLETNPTNEFRASIDAYQDATKQGYSPTQLPTISNSLVVLNTRTDQYNYTPSPAIPLTPTILKKKEISSQLNETDKLIILQPMRYDVKRNILEQSKVDSTYIAGYEEKKNPDYLVAYRNYQIALNHYNQVQFEVSLTSAPTSALGGLGQGISNMAKTIPAANRLDKAKQTLAQTSQTISIPIKQEYSYNEMKVKVSKELNYYLYIINPTTQEVRYKAFLKAENKTFQLQYNKHSQDSSYPSKYDDEKAVMAYETERSGQNLSTSEIIRELCDAPLKEFRTVKYDSQMAFIQAPLKTKKPQAQLVSKTNSKINRLFQSVVAIQDNGGRTIGTGFFIKPDTILSNQHVVGDRKLVAVTTRGGKKYIGKVVNVHFDLDIAIIQIDGAGLPVELYAGPALSEGSEVLAIGNPVGLEYSVTKGIISSIRKRKDNKRPLASERIFIQTDVAINPGNSGGPLFMDGKVIGINTLKLVDEDIEGIGFAIHYSEVNNYLSDQGIKVNTHGIRPTVNNNEVDSAVSDRLKTLKKLYTSGLIDKDEYKVKKKEIIESI
jgi:S1-C subfamily serine protease